MTEKKITVEFAPGCFDAFEGSQEELAELIAEIQALAESGELMDDSRIVEVDEMDDDEYEEMQRAMTNLDKRSLQ